MLLFGFTSTNPQAADNNRRKFLVIVSWGCFRLNCSLIASRTICSTISYDCRYLGCTGISTLSIPLRVCASGVLRPPSSSVGADGTGDDVVSRAAPSAPDNSGVRRDFGGTCVLNAVMMLSTKPLHSSLSTQIRSPRASSTYNYSRN